MNYRYFIGKLISNLLHSSLSSPLMPLTRVVPIGKSYPYDIQRMANSKQIKTIFDVGANIGQTSLFLNRYFPQSTIFSFEPVKDTYNILQAKTHKFHNIRNFQYALAKKEEEQFLVLREDSQLNTLVKEKVATRTDTEITETIKIVALDNFAQEHYIEQIDLLKIDVQGYELEVLSGAKYYLDNNLIKFIYAEISFEPNNPECQYFETLNKFLEANNFSLSGFYEIFRWGKNKRYFGFCNALFVHKTVQ